MKQIFKKYSSNKKWARFLAILWTLLIFILCLLPANEVPRLNIPFIDKWTHFLLFAVFSFLWLLSFATLSWKNYTLIFFSASCYGVFIELLQKYISILGRSFEIADIVADAIGGLIGVIIFSTLFHKKSL